MCLRCRTTDEPLLDPSFLLCSRLPYGRIVFVLCCKVDFSHEPFPIDHLSGSIQRIMATRMDLSSGSMHSIRIVTVGWVVSWAGCNQVAGIEEGKPYPDACVTLADCELGDAECRVATCANERCVYVDEPAGTPLPPEKQVIGDCQEWQCDGVGHKHVVTTEADVPNDNEPCTQDTCVGTDKRFTPLPWVPCYTGPAGTDQLGNCAKGVQLCKGGKADGACEGERAPTTETCLTIFDDDCDGSVNEEGAGCICAPGSVRTCYPGTQESLGYGTCAAGTQQCNALGTAYGECSGFVMPGEEICDSALADEDCDGKINEEGPACMCGDGFVSGTEACDDGNTLDGDGCTSQCKIPGCGNGQKEPSEECDDENADNTDACTSQCKTATCGDGYVQVGVESCDDGNTNETDACTTQCVNARCGDGIIQTGVETCDDGNGDNTDACTTWCLPPLCGDGFVIVGVEGCDDGDGDDTDACLSTCEAASCGDGFVHIDVEQCDDGNLDESDACLSGCLNATCGDGILHVGVEECDDGNADNTDACTTFCKPPACGDGLLLPGVEECDDGNANEMDGCTSACKTATCTMNCQPSCEGLPKNCGPMANEDCCTSLLVPGGTFNRGNNAQYPATLSDFRLDRFEVTVGRMRKFVDAFPANTPAAGAGAHPKIAGSGWNPAWVTSAGTTNWPASKANLIQRLKGADASWTDTVGGNETKALNQVSWFVAFAFCAWDGGRLPTEAEWNYAAAGGNEQRTYPWSNPPSSTTIDQTYAVYSKPAVELVGSTSPKGDAKWGHADMSGNVWEFVRDNFNNNYMNPCNDCAFLNTGSIGANIVIRGGGWGAQTNELTTTRRGSTDGKYYSAGRGLRCARDL